MVRLIAVLAASTALAGCATQSAEVAPPPPAEAPPVAEAPPAPKPTYGTFGFDAAGMDETVVPGDNFYQYANGTWAKTTPIPADKSNYGAFTVLDDLSRQRTKDLIEEQAQDPNSRIGAAYASFMDEAAVEGKGLAPLEPWLAEVRGLKSKSQLDELYAKADRLGIPGAFGSYVGQDAKAPDV